MRRRLVNWWLLDLDGDELWRRNGEYVNAGAYDKAVARIESMRAALLSIASAYDAATEKHNALACELSEIARKALESRDRAML